MLAQRLSKAKAYWQLCTSASQLSLIWKCSTGTGRALWGLAPCTMLTRAKAASAAARACPSLVLVTKFAEQVVASCWRFLFARALAIAWQPRQCIALRWMGAAGSLCLAVQLCSRLMATIAAYCRCLQVLSTKEIILSSWLTIAQLSPAGLGPHGAS